MCFYQDFQITAHQAARLTWKKFQKGWRNSEECVRQEILGVTSQTSANIHNPISNDICMELYAREKWWGKLNLNKRGSREYSINDLKRFAINIWQFWRVHFVWNETEIPMVVIYRFQLFLNFFTRDSSWIKVIFRSARRDLQKPKGALFVKRWADSNGTKNPSFEHSKRVFPVFGDENTPSHQNHEPWTRRGYNWIQRRIRGTKRNMRSASCSKRWAEQIGHG